MKARVVMCQNYRILRLRDTSKGVVRKEGKVHKIRRVITIRIPGRSLCKDQVL